MNSQTTVEFYVQTNLAVPNGKEAVNTTATATVDTINNTDNTLETTLASSSSSRMGTVSRNEPQVRSKQSGIAVITELHQQFYALFKELFSAAISPEVKMVKKNYAITIVSKYILTKEQVIYPTCKMIHLESREDVNKSVEQESFLKQNLIRLDAMDVQHPEFDYFIKATFQLLINHMKHEESTLYPILAKKLGEEELETMGALIETLLDLAHEKPNPSPSVKSLTELAAVPLTTYYNQVRNLTSSRVAASRLR